MQREAHLRAIVDAVNRRDWDTLAELVDPEFELHSAFAGMVDSVYKGADGMAALIREYDTTWDDLRWTVEAVRDNGDRSLVELTLRGRAHASEVPLEQRNWQAIEWKGDRPLRVESFFDRDAALAAAGLSA
jgi:ketosteroid isomerase-like protein